MLILEELARCGAADFFLVVLDTAYRRRITVLGNICDHVHGWLEYRFDTLVKRERERGVWCIGR
jgi:hypothetical protein